MDKLLLCPELILLFNRNNQNVKKKIIKILEELPYDDDDIGWIYGFYSSKDKQLQNNFWIKLGRTDKKSFVDIEDEMGGQIIFYLKTKYNHKLEQLIYLFFDFSKETRIGICNKQKVHQLSCYQILLSYLTCNDNNYTEIPDIQQEIEWFHFTEKINIPSLISQICQLGEETYFLNILNNRKYVKFTI